MEPVNTATLSGAIAAQAAAQSERTAITFLAGRSDGDSLTFGQVHSGAQYIAAALVGAGIKPGDVVLIAGEHDSRLVTGYAGAIYAGAVPTLGPYPTTFNQLALYDRRLCDIATISQARAVLASPDALSRLEQPLAVLGCQALDLDALTQRASTQPGVARQLCIPDPTTPAYMQFSSGTTGTPKGAIVTHAALLRHLQMLTAGLQLTTDDVLVGWAPFYHDLGLVVYLLLPLVCGIPALTIAPDHWVRRPVLLLNALHAHGGTVCIMPNFGFAHTTRNIRQQDIANLDLRRVRHFIAGAEVVQPATLEAFSTRFQHAGLPPEAIKVGYGMTECVFMASVSPPGCSPRVERIDRSAMLNDRCAMPSDAADALAVISCGTPLPETGIEVVDDAGSPLSERQIGEVVISSPALFVSYAGRPELTASAQRDGRLFTGDLGYLAGGELFVVDRKKDLIIAAGKHLYPESLEQLALTALGERAGRAAAFGLPDRDLGTELPVLVCEVRGQVAEDETARLKDAIRQRVFRDASIVLADVRLVRRGWLEITTSGKVSRSATRERYLAAGYRPQSAAAALSPALLADPAALERGLLALARQMLGCAELSPQDNLFNAGADSLTLLRMILQVEKQFNVQIGTFFFRNPTIAYLITLLDPESAPPPAATAPLRRPQRTAYKPLMPSRGRFIHQGPLIRGCALLPYGLGVHLQRAWLADQIVQRRFFAKEVALLRRWGERIGISPAPDIILQSLLANTWRGWRNHTLTAPLGASPWVTVRGDAALWQAQAQPRGLIYLVMHSPLAHLFYRGLIAGGVKVLTLYGHTGEFELREYDRSAQVYQAYQALLRSEAVVIAGDGGKGRQHVVVPFFGGQRPFLQGGAELAVQTGAALVPVFCTLATSGRVNIEVCPPLARTGGAAQAQIERLTRAYADLVVARWPNVYASLEWDNLARWLASTQRHAGEG